MRNVINISLPEQLKKEVDKAVKEGSFASKSEFFRHLLRLWKQHDLVTDVLESEEEFKDKKGNVLHSLADLG